MITNDDPIETENEKLRAEIAGVTQIFQSASDYAIVTLDSGGRVTGWLGGAEQIFGYSATEIMGRAFTTLVSAEHRSDHEITLALCRALDGGRVASEGWRVRRDGSQFWAQGAVMPLMGAQEQRSGFLTIVWDGSESFAAAEHRKSLIVEMSHQMRNTFGLVQSVALQTARCAPGLTAFQKSFKSRLEAIERSYDLLTTGGEDAHLRCVVEDALGDHVTRPGRTTIDGPPVQLTASMVMALTLAFHELTKNAEQHGSLSVPEGTVHVRWAVKAEEAASRTIELSWRESDGPETGTPQRQGFGLHLLGEGFGQLGSSVRLRFPPDGLRCDIFFPCKSWHPTDFSRAM